MIDDIGLREKVDSEASALSGGQKRRLSVGMALIGDPQIVFLGACTPVSAPLPSPGCAFSLVYARRGAQMNRRLAWTLLRAVRCGRYLRR